MSSSRSHTPLTTVCPASCSSAGRHAPEDVETVTIDGAPVPMLDHPGPRFGPFVCSIESDVDGGRQRASVILGTGEDFDAADHGTGDQGALRRLGEHAAAAAAWLESVQ